MSEDLVGEKLVKYDPDLFEYLRLRVPRAALLRFVTVDTVPDALRLSSRLDPSVCDRALACGIDSFVIDSFLNTEVAPAFDHAPASIREVKESIASAASEA